MEAGLLNRRITLQRPVEVRGADYADVQVTWQDVATVWASVEPLSGGEFFRNQEQQGELTHRVRIRWRAGVDSKMRVLFGTRIFGIDSVINPEEADVVLELMCTESLSG
jgi:SPP1 family predicted phage head-tail adaptor